MPLYYTIDEAAHVLELTPDSLYRYILRGKLTATERGKQGRISSNEIERFQRERHGPGARPGSKMRDETKKKLSELRKGDKNPFSGKKHTDETRAKMSAYQSQQGRGVESPSWKGGRVFDTHGYVLIYAPDHPAAVNRYVPEHRLVMEQVLGRYLEAHEEVHHKYGLVTDNNPDNLEVLTKGEHSRFHRLNPHIRRRREG